jgi:colanic acid/amylovoran biosynthesis glycosyltransferase
VLATLVDKHVELAELCAVFQTPLVYIAEYSVLTRRQIIRAETHNPLLRWRREMWTTQLEKQYVACVRRATGVQCNGTPTYEAYRQLNRQTLLYFDTRVRQSQLVNLDVLNVRTEEMRSGAPLRLAFSGRLIAMKGVDHLPRVAQALQRLGVDFTLEIFGGGELEEPIEKAIHRMQLKDCVFTRGVLDFATGLLPRMSRTVDLFVCCHRQGDPSCTYLETYSCGTPIVGYDNEALKGLVSLSNVGWISPLDQPQLLAQRIAHLNQRRDLLAHAAFAARRFAATHTFEKTMQIRIDHLLGCTQPLALEAKAS